MTMNVPDFWSVHRDQRRRALHAHLEDLQCRAVERCGRVDGTLVASLTLLIQLGFWGDPVKELVVAGLKFAECASVRNGRVGRPPRRGRALLEELARRFNPGLASATADFGEAVAVWMRHGRHSWEEIFRIAEELCPEFERAVQRTLATDTN